LAFLNHGSKGTKAGDIPIERPSHFTFTVNLRIAKALGITIPPAVMVQATRVVE
jgi:putative ABC transport system substrate-binding protein